MAIIGAWFQIADSDGTFLSNSKQNDLIINTSGSNQRVLIGCGDSNSSSTFAVGSNIVHVAGDVNMSGNITSPNNVINIIGISLSNTTLTCEETNVTNLNVTNNLISQNANITNITMDSCTTNNFTSTSANISNFFSSNVTFDTCVVNNFTVTPNPEKQQMSVFGNYVAMGSSSNTYIAIQADGSNNKGMTGDINANLYIGSIMNPSVFIEHISGNVGINTSSPLSQAHVLGSNSGSVLIVENQGNTRLIYGDSTISTQTSSNNSWVNTDLIINNNLAIGASSSEGYSLFVQGSCYTTDGFLQGSDRRFKTDITKIENALEKLCLISGYTFTIANNSQRSTGLIAQEVEAILPEAVHQDSKGFMSVAYGNIIGLLVEAIKEIKQDLDMIKSKS